MRDGITPLLAAKAGLRCVEEARYLQTKSGDGRKEGVRSENNTGHRVFKSPFSYRGLHYGGELR